MKKRLASSVLCFMTALAMLAPGTGDLTMAKAQDDTVDKAVENAQVKKDAFAFSSKKQAAGVLKTESILPSKFDLRDVNGENYVTPVRFQNPFGTCWGFGAVAAAEISLLGSGIAQQDQYNVDTLHLSEKHLAYFSNQTIDDKYNPQYGEGTEYKQGMTTTDKLNTGGNAFVATSLFASGVGVNLQDRTDPDTGQSMLDLLGYYGREKEITKKKINGSWVDFCYSDQDDWDIPSKYRNYQSYVLSESNCLPSPSGRTDDDDPYKYTPEATAAIKGELFDKKGVEIGFAADTSRPDQSESTKYISDKWAHYTYDDKAVPTHAVTIIGWDDNFDKSNFLKGHQPDKNGAWLVKNSWGSEERTFPNKGPGWGILQDPEKEYDPETNVHTGYFWLSYYDKSLTLPESFSFDKSNVGTSYYLDQHDTMPATDQLGLESKDKLSMANVFTAEDNQVLEYVSSQNTTPKASVLFEIYLLADDNEGPLDGIKVAEKQSPAYDYGGFHKEKLDEPVPLQKGQKYSIVATQKTTDNKYCIAVNAGMSKANAMYSNSPKWSVGVVNKGESFLIKGNIYDDLSLRETKKALLGGEVDMVSIDNFSIKGFCAEDEDNKLNIALSGNKRLSLVAGYNTADLSVALKGKGDIPGGGSGNVTWEIKDPSIATLTPGKDDTQCTLTAKKYGTTYLTVKVDGVGERLFKINVARHELESAELEKTKYVYDGKVKKPKVKNVTGSYDRMLKEGTDYKVSYASNKNAGKGKVIVKGTGDYEGTLDLEFSISKAKNTLKAKGKSVKLKKKKLKKKKQTIKKAKAYKISKAKGKLTYKKAGISKKKYSKKFTVAKKTGLITVKKGVKKGTYKLKVKVTAAGNNNYKKLTRTVTVKIKVK